jgi:hypothetical protein
MKMALGEPHRSEAVCIREFSSFNQQLVFAVAGLLSITGKI